MKKLIFSLVLSLFVSTIAFANQEKVVQETFTIMPNMEMLIDHSFYKGVKVQSIKIKRVEIKHDTFIKNGEIKEGEPNSIYVIIEITDMNGNKTEIFGNRPLSLGDYEFEIQP